MRSFMNGLPLQALSVLLIICTANGAPYSSEYNVSIKRERGVRRLTCDG
jgi:hypothetical protein